MTNAYGSRSQKRMRISLTSNSRSVGLNDFTTPKKVMPDLVEIDSLSALGSAMNHWKTAVATLRTMQPSSA